MAIFPRIKTPLPQNLHPAVTRAIQGGKIDIPGRKLPLSRLEVWDQAVDEAEILADFRRDDGRLEELADRWASQEAGRIYNDRRDSYLEGGFEEGEYLSYSRHSVQYSRLGPGIIEHLVQNTQGEGRITYSHLDLNDPSRSFQTFINSEGEALEPLRPNRQRYTETSPSQPAVLGLAQALKAQGGAAKAIFLDGSQSLAEHRLERRESVKTSLESLSSQQQQNFQGILDASRSSMPLELYHQAAKELADASPQERDTLLAIRQQAGDWAALESIPENSADGVTRGLVSYVSPEVLRAQAAERQWEFDEKTGLPIADSVVIGAGPGGLASGYHLANTGARTLIFESKSAGQAFSDDNAKSVKALRTSVASTDILGSNWRGFEGHEASLRNQFPSIVSNLEEAQSEWEQATGEELQEPGQREQLGPFETAFPRAGLYEHLQRMATGLTQHYPDTFLIERSPVKDVRAVHDGLFEVTTHNGHQVLTRTLVPATGFVGSDGQLSRQLPSLNALAKAAPDQVLAVQHDNAEMAQAQQISDNLRSLKKEGKLKQAVIASDRKLGSPDIRALVRELPEGSQIGFVGGGESGVKGILEAAKLNPQVRINFYVSRPLEPYQTQVPSGHLDFSNIKAVRQHPELKDKTFELLEATDFGSPITTASLGELFDLVGEGRVQIHNLGQRFSEESIQTELGAGPSGSLIRLQARNPEVQASIVAEREQLHRSGLIEAKDVHSIPPQDLSMLFTSIGYNTRAAKAPEYMKGLIQEGLFNLKSGSLDSRIVTNSAGFATDTADTALAGRAIQGWETAEALSSHLPKRQAPEDRLRDDLIRQGIKVGKTPKPQTLSKERVERVLDSGARTFELLEDVQEETLSADEAALAEQDPLRILNQMNRVLPQYLSPTEQELVQRGQQLLERITDFS